MMEFKNQKIWCNKCGWETLANDWNRWVNVKCPACGQCVLVTEQEIAIKDSFEQYTNKIFKGIGRALKGSRDDLTIELDMFPLRKNKPAKTTVKLGGKVIK